MLRGFPWLNSVSSDEAIGLETDVMRFMAILGFCLMIVFALLQALPVTSSPDNEKPIDPAADMTLLAHRPPQNPLDQPAQPARNEPAAKPVPAAQSKPQWSLHFASDSALLRLMRDDQVGLYLRRGVSLLRLQANGERVPVAGELQLYSMDTLTVPEFLRVLARTPDSEVATQWSVALSAAIQSQIHALIQRHPPGRLFIQADGSVQRAP